MNQEPDQREARSGVITKESSLSVEDTVARLLALVTSKGMKVFAVIDHSGAAAGLGLTLRDTKVVIFGSPQAGTPVMQAAPLAALDLPLKVLVWADGSQTKVSYTAPTRTRGPLCAETGAGRETRRYRRPDRRRA